MPARTVICDETDKYPPFLGDESDPLSLAKERASNFWNRKIIKASTPTLETGFIWQEWLHSTREEYFCPCPHCRAFQPLVFSQLKFPDDVRDPEIIERDELAWYECNACAREIEFECRELMTAQGIWCPAGVGVERDGTLSAEPPSWRHRGFHMSKLISPWVKWSKVVAEFLRSRRDPRKYRNFINSWLGEPWREKAREITAEKIREAARAYDRRTVPDARVVYLTAAADVQLDSFWYVVRAWAPGDRSWLVDYGNVKLWEELEQRILTATFLGVDGRTHGVTLACIDARYRRDEVFKIARRYPRQVRPTMGWQELAAAPLRSHDVDKDERGRPIVGGLKRWDVDTTYFKDRLASFITPEQTGADGKPVASERRWFVFNTIEPHYAAQVTAEHKVAEIQRRTGFVRYVWKPKTAQKANHLGDCEALAIAAAEMLGVHVMAEPEPAPIPPSADQVARSQSRSSWWGGERRPGSGSGGGYW
jgi:phage terminase large subunit GpA-like protein